MDIDCPWDRAKWPGETLTKTKESSFFHDLSIPSFNVCLYAILDFTRNMPSFFLIFFWRGSGPIWTHFEEFLGNNLSK